MSAETHVGYSFYNFMNLTSVGKFLHFSAKLLNAKYHETQLSNCWALHADRRTDMGTL
jgi:ribonucleotide reductase alpha subunit